jgi:hypothetical protein
VTIYGSGNYAQTYTSEKAEIERHRRQELADLFKTLEGSQTLIRIKLEIICRNGKTQTLMDDIKMAAAAYGEAYDAILDSAPIAQKAIGR